MGNATGHICEACGTTFGVRDGGGLFFDMLHCDTCGKAQGVRHRDLDDIHLRFVKGLDHPYAVARMEMDRRIQQEYPGEPVSRRDYHAAAEATLDLCPCGGRFSYDAPARCPNCRSTSEMWRLNPKASIAFYD